jgi:hypothetical protein
MKERDRPCWPVSRGKVARSAVRCMITMLVLGSDDVSCDIFSYFASTETASESQTVCRL